MSGDSFSRFDEVLDRAELSIPWERGIYVPNLDLMQQLLKIPVSAGQAQTQQSGAAAKAFDVWIAHELRRSGFPVNAVWPRTRRPRILPSDLSQLEGSIEELNRLLDEEEERLGKKLKPASIRGVIRRLPKELPGRHATTILGRFYSKQIDVAVSSWQHGPDVLVSTKTMFSSFAKNRANRYEEALGEAPNLRDRYPLAAMGFAFLVRSTIYKEQGAFELLRDLLIRLRRPHGPFDATVLLVADWDDAHLRLNEVDEPSDELQASRFFQDLIKAAISSTPADIHRDVRVRKEGKPKGGVPDGDDDISEYA